MNKKIFKIFITLVFFFSFKSSVFSYNKASVDITTMDIFEIQEAIDNGYLTYELLARLYLDRIEEYDENFNTIISLNENIIEEAKEKDIEYQKNGRSSILFGIPILVKDNIDVYGLATTAGSSTLSDNYPNNDADVIKILKDAGALILGKTNMSKFAFYASSSTSDYGTVKNAYDTYFSSYGSSGGTAVAVSLQFSTLGIGTDTNTSIRLPASSNNVVGFRPTFDLISTNGLIAYDITRDTVGPITRNVAENAILMAVMEGKDESYYLDDIENLELEDVTIGVINDFLYGNDSGLDNTNSTYTEIENLMKDTLEILKENGVTIIELNDFYKKEYQDINYNTLGGWTMCYAFNNYIDDTTSKIKSFYDLAISGNNSTILWEYLTDCSRDIDKINDYASIKKEYDSYVKEVFNRYDLDFLVYPTSKNRVLRTTENTNNLSTPSDLIAPVLGYPSVSISIGSDVEGLYYGMEVLGLKNSEEEIYKFIYKYEQINNKYELSELAPPLYEVPTEVTELINLYEKNKNKDIIITNNSEEYKEYREIKEQVENVLFNYNDLTDGEIANISELLASYEKACLELNKMIQISFLVILVPVVLLLTFIIILSKKRKKSLK